MPDPSSVGLWHSLTFRDADAMIGWLTSLGFIEHAVYRDDSDPTNVMHAELLWPFGGGVMCGSFRDRPDWPKQPGTGAAYLVSDDVDAAFARAVEAGATALRAPRDEDYGGRGASIADPEGNLWSLGTYQGA